MILHAIDDSNAIHGNSGVITDNIITVIDFGLCVPILVLSTFTFIICIRAFFISAFIIMVPKF